MTDPDHHRRLSSTWDDLPDLLAGHRFLAAARRSAPEELEVSVDPAAVRVGADPGSLVLEYAEHWGELYEYTYLMAAGRASADLDLSGWRASDTGEPLSTSHMTEWVERSIELIFSTLAHLPVSQRTVLEIGCGTGLLAARLIPEVNRYVGIDLIPETVEQLTQAHLGTGARFRTAAAHQLDQPAITALLGGGTDDGGTGGADVVVINSVTQCFPDLRYLQDVIARALELVRPGGALLIGDNRHGALALEYCRWLEQADRERNGAEPFDGDNLVARAVARSLRDDELQFDPAALAAILPADQHLRITLHPKLLGVDSELTRYRFDAVIRRNDRRSSEPETVPAGTLGAEELRVLRSATAARPIRIAALPLAPWSADGRSAVQWKTLVSGIDCALELDPFDPRRVSVTAPASAAGFPASTLAAELGHSHEPFPSFVRRRVAEEVRSVATAAGMASAERVLQVRVMLPYPDHPFTTHLGDDLLGAAHGAAEQLVPRSSTAAVPAALSSLDEFAVAAMAATLTPGAAAGSAVPWEQAIASLQAVPRHRWIVERWRALLTEAGAVVQTPSGPAVLRPSRAELSSGRRRLAQQVAEVGYPPEYGAFLLRSLESLPRLLRDEESLRRLLFEDTGHPGSPESLLGAAEGAYVHNKVNRALNAACAGAAAAAVEGLDHPPRILEIGAGVAVTAAAVLERVRRSGTRYLLTDVGPWFLNRAGDQLTGIVADGVVVDTALLDINDLVMDESIGGPGLRARPVDAPSTGGSTAFGPEITCGENDLVIAVNVLHNSIDLPATLAATRLALRPGGRLLLVDTHLESPLLAASMMFLMSPERGEPRAGSCDGRSAGGRIMPTGAQWRNAMVGAGFRIRGTFPDADHPLARVGISLWLAERD